MRFEPLEKFVELSQGLAVNKGTAYMFSNFQSEEFPHPLLRIVDLKDGKKENYSKYVSKNAAESVMIDEHDIVFSRVTCECFRGYRGVLHNNLFAVRLVNQEISEDYLYVALQSSFVQKQALTYASSSVVPDLNHKMFKSIVIPVPNSETQNKIATLYLNITNKVTTNIKISFELESMAKTLYDYWFTQFDFPDENGKPYRTSGGAMEWNEQLKRKIPKGWGSATINQMTKSYRGVSYDKKDLLPTSENGILVLRGNNIQNNRLVYDSNIAYVPHSFVSKEQRIRKHDIILTMSSGSKEHIGKCTMFQHDSPHTYGAFLTKFTPDSDKVGFVYLSMISDFFKKKIQAICNGTGINNLTNETFDNLVFPKPTKSILGSFEEIISPLLEEMGACEKENEELTKLRDWLLPMLMNGQATVE